jgi:hypothetical protein
MSMWTGASDELTNYLAQREVERQRELVNATALQERQRAAEERTYQHGRDAITDARAQRTDARLELQQKQADEDRNARIEETKTNARYRNAAALRETQQPGGLSMDGGAEKKLLDEFSLGNDLYKTIALPVAKLPAQAANVGGAPVGEAITTMGGGTRVQSLGGTDYQAAQRETAARQAAAAQAALERKDLQDERLAAARVSHEENLALRRELAASKAGEDEVPLSEGAITTAAKLYLASGTIPSVGRGPTANANIARIKNRASDLDPEADINTNKVITAADKRTLTHLTDQQGQIEAMSNTARKNYEVLREAANKITDTGSPWVNKHLRQFQGQVLGSPEQAAYDVAMNVVRPELAGILDRGSGIITVHAREEIEKAVRGEMTIPQIVAVYETLLKDMDNRHAANAGQISATNDHLRGITPATKTTPAAPPAAPAAPSGPKKYNPATGKVE